MEFIGPKRQLVLRKERLFTFGISATRKPSEVLLIGLFYGKDPCITIWATLQAREWRKILPQQISWPDKAEYSQIAEEFAQRAGFSGVSGAIEGTYIPITGPTEYRDSYICQKGFPAFH